MIPMWMILCVVFEIVSAATDNVICYHGSWSTYRVDKGKFSVENINPNLCTHLIYSFLGLQEDGNIQHLDTYLDVDLENIHRFNNLKLINKNLRTLVALGGWNEGSEKYSAVAADSSKRAVLISSVISFLQTWGFDGLDLDWEYPGQRGGAIIDKENYATLIKELREEFDKHGFLLTAAVAASANSVDVSYDVPSLSQYLDFINVMAYDFHGSWNAVTGQNAPLYASTRDTTQLLNVDAAIKGWIEKGADPQKIVLGLGAFGRSFTLADASNHGLGAAISGAGNAGNYTSEAGFLGYNEIVELQQQGGWTTVWDNEQKNPYTYKGDQWISFDNPESVSIKVNYAKSLNLGGLMIWSIETDDFRGVSDGTFPLLKTINEALSDGSSSSDTANSDTTANSFSTVPATAGAFVVCTSAGYVRDPSNCSKFYYCLTYGSSYVPLELNCNPGLVFDPNAIACDYPELVQC